MTNVIDSFIEPRHIILSNKKQFFNPRFINEEEHEALVAHTIKVSHMVQAKIELTVSIGVSIVLIENN